MILRRRSGHRSYVALAAFVVASFVPVAASRAQDTPPPKDASIRASKKIVIDAGDEITLRTGDSTIVMKKDGSIVIKGKDITIEGTKITSKQSGSVVVKGSQIRDN